MALNENTIPVRAQELASYAKAALDFGHVGLLERELRKALEDMYVRGVNDGRTAEKLAAKCAALDKKRLHTGPKDADAKPDTRGRKRRVVGVSSHVFSNGRPLRFRQRQTKIASVGTEERRVLDKE